MILSIISLDQLGLRHLCSSSFFATEDPLFYRFISSLNSLEISDFLAIGGSVFLFKFLSSSCLISILNSLSSSFTF
jgi:hypothetical protein